MGCVKRMSLMRAAVHSWICVPINTQLQLGVGVRGRGSGFQLTPNFSWVLGRADVDLGSH
jgi:hypothetical protein